MFNLIWSISLIVLISYSFYVLNDFRNFIKRYSSELNDFRNILEDIEYFDHYVQSELHEVKE